jgi:hypothetical protein
MPPPLNAGPGSPGFNVGDKRVRERLRSIRLAIGTELPEIGPQIPSFGRILDAGK